MIRRGSGTDCPRFLRSVSMGGSYILAIDLGKRSFQICRKDRAACEYAPGWTPGVTIISAPGRANLRWPLRLKRSRAISMQVRGNVFLPVTVPKAQGLISAYCELADLEADEYDETKIGVLDAWPPHSAQYQRR